MSYKSGETVYGAAVTRSGWVIASDAYVTDPDCKTYHVNGRGGKLYDTDVLSGGALNNTVIGSNAAGSTGYLENIRISGGGTVVVRSAGNIGSNIMVYGGDLHVQNALVQTVEVFNGGRLLSTNGAFANGVVSSAILHSGAVGNFSVTGMKYFDLTAEAGATLTIAANFTMGGDIDFAAGTLTNDTNAHAVDGVIEDLDLGINANFSSGITLSNFTQTAGEVNLTSGTAVKGATVAGNMNFRKGTTVQDLTITGGQTVFDPQANVTGTDQIYAENVRLTGGALVVKWNGVVASNVQVSGGILYVRSQGIVRKVDVYDGGDLRVQNQGFGIISGATVHAGGKATQYGTLAAEFTDLTVEAGGSLTLAANFTLKGDINIAQGALTNDADAYTDENGVLTDLTLNTNATFSNGICLSGFSTGADTMIVRGGAKTTFVKDADVTAGTLYVQNGAVGSDIRVHDGAQLQVTNMAAGATLKDITVSAGGQLAHSVKTVFENVDVQAGGSWTLDANFTMNGDIDIAAGALTNDADAHATDGTIYDLDLGLTGAFGQGITLSNFNQTAGAITLVDGASIKTGTMAAGAYLLYLGGGGSITDYTMAGGTLHASNGGIVSGATLDTGAQINISTGAFGYDLTLNGGLAAVRGETAYVSGATVNAGTFYIQSDGSAENVHVYEGGSMQFHYGKVNGLVIEAGGVVNRGWAGADYSRTWENVTAKAGAAMTLDNYFVLKGDLNIAAGALTNDADAHAADGVLEDFDFGMTYGTIASGVTLSNFTQTAGTVDVNADAAVKTAALNAGTLNLNAGATGADIEAMGGTLNVEETAELDGADIGGATVNVAAGAVARNLEVNAGTLNIAAGADVDGVTYNGGTFNISSGATIKNLYKIAGGTVNMYGDAVVDGGYLEGGGYLQALAQNGASGAVIRNYELRGGAADAVIVRAGGNKVENIAVYGGALHVQSGALASDVDVYDGGTITTPDAGRGGATMENIRIHAGGNGVFAANAARAMTIDGLTMDEYAAATFSSANVADFNATGGEVTLIGQKNYVSGGGTLNDLTVLGNGYLWINDPYDATSGGAAYSQMVNSNLTVEAGAYVLMHGTNVYGSDAQIYGSYYVQNGATLSGGTIHDGGYANMWLRNNYNDRSVRAKMVGVTISAGGTAAVTDCDVFDMKTEAGGSLCLFGGAGIGGTANTIEAGTLIVDSVIDADAQTDENHALCNLNVSAQSLQLKSGIALKDLAIGHAGRIVATDATITGFDIEAPEQTEVGRLYLSSGTVASGGRLNGTGTVNAIYMTDGAKLNEMHVSNGGIFMSADASATNLEMTGGIVILRGVHTFVSGATVSAGDLYAQNGGVIDGVTVAGGNLSAYDTNFTNPSGKDEYVYRVTMTDGKIYVGSGATFSDVNATGGKVTVVSGGILNASATNRLNDLNTVAGAKVYVVKAGDNATFQGADTNIADGTLYFSGNAVAGRATNGVFTGFSATQLFKFSVGDDIVVSDVDLNNGEIRVSCFDGASVDTARVSAGAIICNAGASGTMNNVTLVKAGIMNLSGTAQANDTVVSSGGQFALNAATVRAENTTLKAGAKFNINAAGADTGELLTIDFTGTGGNQSVNINSMGNISDDTRIVLDGWTAGCTYTLTTGAATDKTVHMYDWGLYDDAVSGGATYTNAFDGISYDFTNGKAIAVSEFTAAAQATAGSIEDGTTINGNGKAAKWTANTTATGIITAATSAIAGDAWLEIDGTDMGGTTLFGAEVGFAGEVNLYATGDAVINNLAAGATSSGTVAGVKLTVDGATVGLAYAGGFGTVANAAETLIEEGTFTKDFYAGALANYAKTSHATQVGSVSLTITDGEFSGNIYGASAVKAGAATSLVHSVGDVTITVKDGESKKGAQACLFAGGYATGTVASDSAVYTVGNIDVTIENGTWGAAAGGRGVFGGIFASKVTAVAEDVTLTINGGTFGNVFGGGWAQQGGTSIVGDVDIDITGGTIANVFGVGSHSTTGGTTSVDDVTINVSGGDIGTIYAKGKYENDVVTGNVSVNFTGDANFSCGVYGYGYDTTAEADALLSFSAYTGTFSGAINGFVGITLDDDTAMTLTTVAADVSNGKWEFDFTDRADTLAGTSFLTWSSADFAGDTVRVNFTDADQAAAGWNIATADFTGATFTLAINDTDITTVAYDTAISGGDWNGWKFTSVDGTLKFAQITA